MHESTLRQWNILKWTGACTIQLALLFGRGGGLGQPG